MMLFVGAALVGVGVIWLVAANVDIRQVGPLARFAGVAALWVGFVVAGEVVSGGWRGRFGVLAEPLPGPDRVREPPTCSAQEWYVLGQNLVALFGDQHVVFDADAAEVEHPVYPVPRDLVAVTSPAVGIL